MRFIAQLGLVLLLPSAVLAADLSGDDSSSRFYEGELRFSLNHAEEGSAQAASNTISAGYLKAFSDFAAYLTAGNVVYPAPLQNNLDQDLAYLRFVHHIPFLTKGEYFFGGGLTYSSYHLTSTAPGVNAYNADHAAGPHGLVGVAYHLTPQLAFDAQLSGGFFFSKNSSLLYTAQLGITLTPLPPLNLQLGYRSWTHHMDFNNTDLYVSVTNRGPTAALILAF